MNPTRLGHPHGFNPYRRRLVQALAAAAALSGASPLTRAATAAAPYKALVCVFLYGGNDGNNTIVPIDNAGYAAYLAARGDSTTAAGALGLPRPALLPIAPAGGTAAYGLHPDLAPLQALWNSGNLAAVFNLGTLRMPLTKADYLNPAKAKPAHLFSHQDQQFAWQTAQAEGNARTGWGGRAADAMAAAFPTGTVPMMVLGSDPGLLAIGTKTAPLTLPETGAFGLASLGGDYSATVRTAFEQLLAADRDSAMRRATQDVLTSALAASATMQPVLTGTSTVSALFTGQNTSIARQFSQIARVIENHTAVGNARQVFFVSLGSFDTHTDQLNRQSNLFRQLAPAMKSFHDAMVQLGLDDQVTTFTMSDFARTLKPASGGGSDHAWGSHHFVMGGAVQGQATYGTYPQLVLGGPDDVGNEGRWLPGLSVDQYLATLLAWLGTAQTDLPAVLPNLSAFTTANLGFMRPGT